MEEATTGEARTGRRLLRLGRHGLAAVVEEQLAGRDGEPIVAGLTRSVAEIFRMVGFDTVFRIYTDVDEAIRSRSVEVDG